MHAGRPKAMLSSAVRLRRRAWSVPLACGLILLPQPRCFSVLSANKFGQQAFEFLQLVAPSLDDGLAHKGQGGRVAIIGGSKDYTGAPYYAGMAALRTGAELVYIYTAEEASLPIKTYSPELMVTPIYSGQPDASEILRKVTPNLDRLHSIVIGCGLGRLPGVLKGAMQILREAQVRGIPVVVDADGLQAIVEDPKAVSGADRVVLTPNVAEFRRLLVSVGADPDVTSTKEEKLIELVRKLQGPTVLLKGPTDLVAMPDQSQVLAFSERGCPRRSGGFGDVLAGTLGTLVGWLHIQQGSSGTLELGNAAGAASTIVRRSCERAFRQHFRATTAPNVLEELGPAFRTIFPF